MALNDDLIAAVKPVINTANAKYVMLYYFQSTGAICTTSIDEDDNYVTQCQELNPEV